MRKTLPSYNNGTIYVFEKVMNKLDNQSSDLKKQEDRFTKRIAKVEDENEILDIQLKNKRNEVAKLDRDLRKKEVSRFHIV